MSKIYQHRKFFTFGMVEKEPWWLVQFAQLREKSSAPGDSIIATLAYW